MTRQDLDDLRKELSQVIALQNRAIAEEQKARTEQVQRSAGDLDAYGQAIAQLKADNGQLAKNMEKLVAEMTRLRQENAALRQDLAAQNAALVDQIKARFAAVDAAVHAEGQARQAAVQTEATARQAADQQMIKDFARTFQDFARQVNAGSGGGAPAPSNDTPMSIYVVQSGDTLAAISAAFKVSVSRLRTVNNLKSDSLFVGQKLRIPKD